MWGVEDRFVMVEYVTKLGSALIGKGGLLMFVVCFVLNRNVLNHTKHSCAGWR